jgi:hypothetical protein
MTFVSSPFIETSLVGKSFKAKQASIKEFFRCNLTLVHVEIDDEDEGIEVQIPICSASENTVPPVAPAPANPPAEFYAQLIKTMKNLPAPQQPSKIIINSRDHEESVNLPKLQNGMLQLMYAISEIDWDDGVAKNICLATFSQRFLNLLARSASVQATQLSNLFVTIFTAEPKDEEDDTPLNPLIRLMSLVVFPQNSQRVTSTQASRALLLRLAQSTSLHQSTCSTMHHKPTESS